MDIILSNGDIVKIVASAVSMLLLFLFRRKIMKIVTDIVVGSDTGEYDKVEIATLKERIDERIDEVLR